MSVRHRFERLDEDQGFPQPFGGLWPAREGGLWYSPHPGTLVRIKDRIVRTWQVRPRRIPGGSEEIIGHQILRVWAGFDQGVLWLDEGGAVRSLPERLSHPDVRVIHEDRRGDLWFGTYGGGLNRLREGRITSYMTSLGEYNNQAWCIDEDADGVFWVGTRNGLNRFVPPGVSPPEPPAVPSALAGEGAGARGDVFTFTTRQGLVENRINNVAAGRQARALVLAFGEPSRAPAENRGTLHLSVCARERDHHRTVRAPSTTMSIRVGIVEDDRSMRENLALLIDGAPGFSCVAACGSGEEALPPYNSHPARRASCACLPRGVDPRRSGMNSGSAPAPSTRTCGTSTRSCTCARARKPWPASWAGDPTANRMSPSPPHLRSVLNR